MYREVDRCADNLAKEGCSLLANFVVLDYPHSAELCVCLAKIIFVNLFYYSAYFCSYLLISLHFLVLFISPTLLFQLTFIFIYNTFSNKNLISAK